MERNRCLSVTLTRYKMMFLIPAAIILQLGMVLPSSYTQANYELEVEQSCPLWTTPNMKNGTCECGNSLDGIVYCEPSTLDISVLMYHCMTYNSDKNEVLVGHCFFNYFSKSHYSNAKYLHRKIKTDNASQLNYDMCHRYYDTREHIQRQLYRTGQMCGSCESNYSPPAYSYSVACVKCISDYKYNWLKYIAIAFLPLTVFYIIVVLFRITITSGSMNGFVLASQIMACPAQARSLIISRNTHSIPFKINTISYGILNLDFFRDVYHPFCLHPKMTTLQVLALDYLVAVYPLVLIIITYVLVKLHNRYSVFVRMWRPFYWCFARIRREWDISKSLIGAFATFLLLSYVKILYVSSDLLAPNILYDVTGSRYPKLYLIYDGTYELFGKEHLPYALLAITMVTVFNIVPLVLLALYPCRCFQRCLNHCCPKRELFRTFAETFHGCFKLKPHDCRYFAALYLLLRFIVLIAYATGHAPAYYLPVALTFLITALIVAITRPYKHTFDNIVDTFLLALTGMGFLWQPLYTAIETLEPGDISLVNNTKIFAMIQPLYGVIIVTYHLLPKKYLLKIVQFCKHFTRRQEENEEEFLSYRTRLYIESSPLLQEHNPTN